MLNFPSKETKNGKLATSTNEQFEVWHVHYIYIYKKKEKKKKKTCIKPIMIINKFINRMVLIKIFLNGSIRFLRDIMNGNIN